MSYIPNLTALPLHEILLDNGYVINKNKHSKNNPCLKHENEEGSLVIFKNQNKDGSISYTYKETHTDKVGNIITFCKDRNISVEDLLAGKLEGYRNKKDTLQARDNSSENNEEIQKIINEFKNLKPYDLQNATLIKKRGIDTKLLEPYKEHLKTDNFETLNAAKYLTFENKNLNVIPIHQCGINKRLNTPLSTDKEGNIRDKPLKSIAQGSKGIEVLFPNESKTLQEHEENQIKRAEEISITENENELAKQELEKYALEAENKSLKQYNESQNPDTLYEQQVAQELI
ncbi:hypothetical protein HSHS1_12860 [Helicobacter suis HS1]|nr:hypothetical protein HSHS1_12860 [Helicobacter suis HS1]